EAVDARRVDDVSLLRLHQHRQEGADAEINAAPVDVEGALPLFPAAGDKAAAAGDAGVVEQQMDLVCRMLLGDLAAEALEIILDRDIGDMGGDAQALRQAWRLAQSLWFGHCLPC